MPHQEILGELQDALHAAAEGNIPTPDERDELQRTLAREMLAARLLMENRVAIEPLDVRSRTEIAEKLGYLSTEAPVLLQQDSTEQVAETQ